MPQFIMWFILSGALNVWEQNKEFEELTVAVSFFCTKKQLCTFVFMVLTRVNSIVMIKPIQ